MSFYTEKTDFLPDLTCPHCGQGHDITWDTEYGDPLTGEECTECLTCDKPFSFVAQTVYTVLKR